MYCILVRSARRGGERMLLLSDRRAVVTGAARGLGFAMAESFVAHGAHVVIADIDGQAAADAAAKLVAEGGRAIGVACDVTSATEVETLVQRCVDEFGRIDVMVNNAGITRDASMPKMSLED